MSSHDLQSSRRIWTEYWRGGRRGCLTEEAPASARGHIENLWRCWFRQLPRGARIIDLATGAGDVARNALSIGGEAELRFVIEGVDLAEFDGTVETEPSARGTTMRVQGSIDLARLPFSNKSFDCAVSQFGIEYAHVEAACCELARVLKPTGGGLFLVHHRESEISTAAASRLQAFTSVIGNSAMLDSARQVYEAISARASQSLVAARLQKFRQSLHAALETHSLGYAWETNLREILGFLSDLARNPHIYDPFDALRRLDAARDMIAAWKSRQESQLAAALDENGMRAFADTHRRCGLNPLEISVVKDPANGAILAWRFAFAATGLA